MNKNMKKLVKYLAEYIETELERFDDPDENPEIITNPNLMPDIGSYLDWIEQGLEAFESVEHVKIKIEVE